MRVLVTGAAGFLGSHVVDRLIAEGHDVTGLDNLKRGNKSLLDPYVATGSLRFCEADIRDIVAVKKAMLGCDTVFHLAAQSNVMGALDDPDYSFESNVIGTYNVLKAASIAGVRSLVFSSSREVYGEPRCLPASEDLPVEPRNPYGASKLAGEAYCRVWRETMGLNCTVLRFGNLYGPRDNGRVISIWLRRARCGQELILFGGQQVLDFVWVDLAVEALLRAAGCGTFGPINIASGVGTALRTSLCESSRSRGLIRRLTSAREKCRSDQIRGRHLADEGNFGLSSRPGPALPPRRIA